MYPCCIDNHTFYRKPYDLRELLRKDKRKLDLLFLVKQRLAYSIPYNFYSYILACPATSVTNTAGLQLSSSGGSSQMLLCTSSSFTFPNGQNSNMFICTNGVWGPQNPSTFACTQPATTPGSMHKSL